jgi:leucyl aminopeptidase
MFTNDNTECSTKISIISQNKFDQWLIKQPLFNKNWCLSNNFKGEKGKIIKIPYPDGRLKEVIIGEGKNADLSGISSFSSTNIGNYFFSIRFSDSSDLDVQKAWVWGQYQSEGKKSQSFLYVRNKEEIKFLKHYSKTLKLSLGLINMPANELNPLTFYQKIKKHELFSKFYFKEYSISQIKKNFPLTYAVGKSSNVNPQFFTSF